MTRVFSGVQPSGILHIGNYLGALKQWVALQDEHECFFSIVDLHAITVPQEPAVLRENIVKTAALYLAIGVDPERSTLFVQSRVQEHAELAWILNTLTKLSELKLMHQFKEKSKAHPEHITVGLFDYPVLMAADILLYKTQLVPVGEDQQQHIELAREIARRFNATFGELFPTPEVLLSEKGARIMALDDPTKKMQKSARSAYNYMSLTDSPEEIRRKMSRAVTDSGNDIMHGPQKPALSNLLTIYHLFSGEPIKDIEKRYVGKGYKEFKDDLSDIVISFTTPLLKKYETLMRDQKRLANILETGAAKARTHAHNTMEEVRRAVGLG